LTAVTANHTQAADTIAPITTSTYRKALWEKTVPRRTMVTSRNTQTSATWTDTNPRRVMIRNAVKGSEPSSGSLPLANAHTRPAWTTTVPASTTTSTAQSARTVSLPTPTPSIDWRWESIEYR
jgi:hypothetical protein